MSGPVLEWACSARPIPGESVCGDQALVDVDGQLALAAAVDGLGHGPDAAVAAERALEAIAGCTATDVVDLAERCHEALRRTRGAALSMASLDGGSATMTWLGVGNVEGRIVRASSERARNESLLLAPGVVGHELPFLRAASERLTRGDLLLFATDGIDPAFADALHTTGTCRAIADGVLERHARPSDDALVLVVRYLGRQA